MQQDADRLVEIALGVPSTSNEAWEAAFGLKQLGGAAIPPMRLLVRRSAPRSRRLGIDVLSELCWRPDEQPTDEPLAIVLDALAVESDPEVLKWIGIALGRLREPRVIVPLTELAARSDTTVRLGAAMGFLIGTDGFGRWPWDEHEVGLALAGLIEDDEPKVQHLAFEVLGEANQPDGDEVREALAGAVTDAGQRSRLAVIALARRGDLRAVPFIESALTTAPDMQDAVSQPPDGNGQFRVTLAPSEADDYSVPSLLAAAAELYVATGDPRLLRGLELVGESWNDTYWYQEAMRRCSDRAT